jgi:hypothetical protein
MKLFIGIVIAALVSTAAIADTPKGQKEVLGTAGEGFIYGGFGPHNDSR